MEPKEFIMATGSEAVAHVAYKTNDVCVLYPITPASDMSEMVEKWSAEQRKNIFGTVPSTFEMQSEAGVAGAMHGALQAGSLTTTFTASQGLLLMLPNMYKIAGELTPNVIHVATRTIATHALSVFSDHSDVMAVRNAGYAILGSASVQESMDFALIAQAATLKSRIPFVHFFDGFRTSHESAKIEKLSDETIKSMMEKGLVRAHQQLALNPNAPVIRGTSQGADTYFQSREAVNSYYEACPDIVQEQMDKFAQLTGRQYDIFEYVGHPAAEQVLVAMASASETIEETIKYLNKQGEKIGLVKVRLFRPFSTKHLVNAIPHTCQAIAVLDRTKESGATGEPLYLDVVTSFAEAVGNFFPHFPKIIGGRYGLSSKEFTPAMAKAVVENLKQEFPKNNFTVGINDDITHLSLAFEEDFDLEKEHFEAVFYETKSGQSEIDFSAMVQLIGEQPDQFVQSFSEVEYKKWGAKSTTHLRVAQQPISAPFLVQNADFVACESVEMLEKENVFAMLKTYAVVLIGTALSEDEFVAMLSAEIIEIILEKCIQIYTINPTRLGENYLIEGKRISPFQACFAQLFEELFPPFFSKDIAEKLIEIDTSNLSNTTTMENQLKLNQENTLVETLLAGKGNDLPVSAFPADGTYQTGTSALAQTQVGWELPSWNPEKCIQCGACSMACPQGAIRPKVYDDDTLSVVPKGFQSAKSMEEDWEEFAWNFTLQVNPEHCTGCNNCVDACEAGALEMIDRESIASAEQENWAFFQQIAEMDRAKIDATKVSQQQLQEPLFTYPQGSLACGEAPYLKLISQLFGDRMLIANATGSSSIFGGALPTTPWGKNAAGQGPAWSNSLFEDNAEFGLGFRLSLDQKTQQARELLEGLAIYLGDKAYDILNAPQGNEEEINAQRERVDNLKIILELVQLQEAKELLEIADHLVEKSVWIVGGDGWAYDIGYGGLDHVLASGLNVNILVLDNEVYENTGGQMSKSTPYGASAAFGSGGKKKQKKDLGMMAMNYEDVYVASVAIGADQEHTLHTLLEAESFDGPSIIIAYCHSEAHGIDVKNPRQYHQAAVDSGQWILYRNDPRRVENGFSPFQLDSAVPSIRVEEYLKMQGRFGKFTQKNELDPVVMAKLQRAVDRRFEKYELLSLTNTWLYEKQEYQEVLESKSISEGFDESYIIGC